MTTLALVRDFTPTHQDEQREARMSTILARFNRSANRAERQSLIDQYRNLHQQRSPEYVAWLESSKGLHQCRG